MKTLLATIILCLLFPCVYAQVNNTERYVSLGVHVGSAHYFGDLSPKNTALSTDLALLEPSLGIEAEKRINARFSVQANLQWLRLLGDDFKANPNSSNYLRNLHFRNDVLELSALGKWELFPSKGHHAYRSSWTPYLVGGLALIHHNPKVKTAPQNGGIWVPTQPLATEGQNENYNLFGWAIPVGLGFRWKVAPKVDISLEARYRFTYTDYLDDVSGNYANPNSFGENELARQLADRSQEFIAARVNEERVNVNTEPFEGGTLRGDSRSADSYFTTALKVSYIISKNKKRETLSRLHIINTPSEVLLSSDTVTLDSTFYKFEDRYTVENLAINSANSEMSPKFYQGGLVYVSDKRDNKNFEKRSRSGFYNFFYSPIHDLFKDELTKPIFLRDKKYLKYHHFSADYIPSRSKVILSLYENTDNSGSIKHRKLYIADVIGENVWENITPLPFNSDESSITQCTVSADGKKLYFVSDREGGFGGTDIYVSYFYEGQWTYPINVGGKINTSGNEMFPFIHNDNQLYFASDGHKGMGGLDLFEVALTKEGTIKEVRNLGAPINSPQDDFGLTLDAVKRRGYFTSNRVGGKGGNDIYQLEVNKLASSRELTDSIDSLYQVQKITLEGMLVNENTNIPVPRAIVKLYNKIEDDLLLTRSDDFGRFSFEVKSDALYEIGSTVRGFQRMENQPISTVGMNTQDTMKYTLKMKPVEYKFYVKGTVTDKESQKPMVGAEVVLLNLYEDEYQNVDTDIDGSYRFQLKKNHNYVLFLLERGYKNWEMELSTFNKRSSETKIVNVQLEKKPLLGDE